MKIDKEQKYKYNDNGRIIIPSESIIQTLPKDGGDKWNRLIFSKSPYLLQHSANPVDWYPWNNEAFEIAKKLNKPIFLSIGYTTCHWCHVMEHESFEDIEVAKLLNETFINIKVDREERPDIDNVYMHVTQQMTGRGGWPMTVIMTPDKKPFFAGTFLPKESNSSYNRPGMLDIIPQIKKLWNTREDSILNSADKIVSLVQKNNLTNISKEKLRPSILKESYHYFNNRFDHLYGGFSGSINKFPKPHDYSFLMRYYYKTNNHNALEIVKKSLYEMKKGGIFDQIGYGFHRYSTDTKWLVPHFEKMLYDQALLIHAYLDAYQITKDEFYSQTVHQLCEYILRDMTDENGGFYSAEDADSQGEEGVFYIWSESELKKVLTKNEYEFIFPILSISKKGNAIVEGNRVNIPYLKKTIKELSEISNENYNDYLIKFNQIRKKIFEYRDLRVHPQKDDKILTDWNGLMISALSRAGIILDEKKYILAAKASTAFIVTNLIDSDGGLFKGFRNGRIDVKGMVEDYAFFIWGLIELYQATLETKYIQLAKDLSDYQIKYFWDKENKGFFFTSDLEETLFVRSKEVYDGAIPSGNSVSALNFIRLGRILSKYEYDEICYAILDTFSSKLNRYVTGSSYMLQAINYIEGPSYEIIIKGDIDKNLSLIRKIQKHPQPNKVIIYNNDKNINFNFLEKYKSGPEEHPLIYICQDYSCQLPTNDIIKINEMLK